MSEAELLLRSELDRLFPAPVAQPDWKAVLTDAGVTEKQATRRGLVALRKRKRLVVVGVGLLMLAVGGAAVAGTRGWWPFAGIAAATHPEKTGDVLDPAVVAQLAQLSHRSPLAPQFLIHSSRLVAAFSGGGRLYVVATAKGELCMVRVKNATRLATVGCGKPLTQTMPTTITTEDLVVNGPNATTPLTYGIARDGISAVSFIAGGREKTVRVKNNVWAYEGRNQALRSLTVHYANGTTRTLRH